MMMQHRSKGEKAVARLFPPFPFVPPFFFSLTFLRFFIQVFFLFFSAGCWPLTRSSSACRFAALPSPRKSVTLTA
jgi:hypothetical protein